MSTAASEELPPLPLFSTSTATAAVTLDKRVLQELHDEEDSKMPVWMRYHPKAAKECSDAAPSTRALEQEKAVLHEGGANCATKVVKPSNPFSEYNQTATKGGGGGAVRRSTRNSRRQTPYATATSEAAVKDAPRKRLNVDETALLFSFM